MLRESSLQRKHTKDYFDTSARLDGPISDKLEEVVCGSVIWYGLSENVTWTMIWRVIYIGKLLKDQTWLNGEYLNSCCFLEIARLNKSLFGLENLLVKLIIQSWRKLITFGQYSMDPGTRNVDMIKQTKSGLASVHMHLITVGASMLLQ